MTQDRQHQVAKTPMRHHLRRGAAAAAGQRAARLDDRDGPPRPRHPWGAGVTIIFWPK